jgi:predicted metal-dependent peptidase
MLAALEGAPKLAGHTVLLVDTSGSMNDRLSAKSELRRIDAAAGLAMLLREVCEDVAIFAFDNHVVAVPPRRGFALRDVLGRAGGGTDTRQAVLLANQQKADRIIVITDEQSATAIPAPAARFGYVMNVAAYQNGIGYGSWIHVSGFSEHLVRYIVQAEQDVLR